ncbi:hypothetical protein Tco_1539976 [Tanacetum coccineum]
MIMLLVQFWVSCVLQWGIILNQPGFIFVEGLGHYSPFSVGQFCDSDLEVALQKELLFFPNLPHGSRATSTRHGYGLQHDYSVTLGYIFSDQKKKAPECNLNLPEAILLYFFRHRYSYGLKRLLLLLLHQKNAHIHRRFNKNTNTSSLTAETDISFLHVFGALCYPKNDREDIWEVGAKGVFGFFIGYLPDSLLMCSTGLGLGCEEGTPRGKDIDFERTFALLLKNGSIWIFLDFAAHKSFTVFQMDVKTAFLHVKEAYMDLLQGPRGHGTMNCQRFSTTEFSSKAHLIHRWFYKTLDDDILWLQIRTLYNATGLCALGGFQAKPNEKHLKGDVTMRDVKTLQEYFGGAQFLGGYSWLAGPQETRCSALSTAGSRICVFIRLLCPSHLDADTVNGLWLSLQQDSNLL